MPTRRSNILFLAFLLTATSTLLSAGETTLDLDKPVSLTLENAKAVDVLASFAALANAEPQIDPLVAGSVTIQLQDVSARTTLNALCEMLDCTWQITEGPPRRLVVEAIEGTPRPAPKPADSPASDTLDSLVDLSLDQAPAERILKTIARIGQWKLSMNRPTVSVDLEQVPLRDALDEVCVQAGCTWSLDQTGEENILRIEWID